MRVKAKGVEERVTALRVSEARREDREGLKALRVKAPQPQQLKRLRAQEAMMRRRQRERLEAENTALAAADLQGQLAALSATRSESEAQATAAQQELVRTLNELQDARVRERQAAAVADEARERLQAFRGQVVSLEAMQQAALGQAQGEVTRWLAGHGLGDRPRLARELNVERGWERAVETVLGVEPLNQRHYAYSMMIHLGTNAKQNRLLLRAAP